MGAPRNELGQAARASALCRHGEARVVGKAIDRLIIWGSPQTVTEKLLAFREEVGDFGTLLYAGKDWLDRDLGRRSMVLLAEKVLPAVNAAIARGKQAAE